MNNTWEKQPQETVNQYNAFVMYCEPAYGYDIKNVYDAYCSRYGKINFSTFRSWSNGGIGASKYGLSWSERRADKESVMLSTIIKDEAIILAEQRREARQRIVDDTTEIASLIMNSIRHAVNEAKESLQVLLQESSSGDISAKVHIQSKPLMDLTSAYTNAANTLMSALEDRGSASKVTHQQTNNIFAPVVNLGDDTQRILKALGIDNNVQIDDNAIEGVFTDND